MKLTVNSEAVAAFVHDRADVPLLAGCTLWLYQRQLARFEHVRCEMAAHAQAGVAASGFNEYVTFLGERPVEVQRRVLSHPSFAIWLQVAEALLLREAHILFPGFHVTTHLQDFGRFAVAAALLDKESRIETTLRRDENGCLALSGAGVRLHGRVQNAHRNVSLSVEAGTLDTTDAVALQTVPTAFDGIEIEGFDWSLRITGRPAFTFMPLDDAAIVKWQTSLGSCKMMLGAAWPAMREEIVQAIRCVIPVAPSGPDVHASATFQEAPGLTALSWTSDVDVLAEALVHEHHHQKLNALLATAPLLTEARGGRYYSPWRNDPRPILGLLHGAYSFQSVVKFWVKAFEADIPVLQMRRAVQRTHMTYLQVREALDTLSRYDGLTPLGQTLVAAMSEAMDAVEAGLPPIAPAARERVGQAMAKHRSTWDAKNAAVSASSAIRPPTPTAEEQALLDRLSLTWPKALRTLGARDFSEDEILRSMGSAAGGNLIEGLSPEVVGSSALLSLVEAHQAYIQDRFEAALEAYRQFGRLSPDGSAYAATCSAFCLRHLGRWADAELVLGPSPRLGMQSND